MERDNADEPAREQHAEVDRQLPRRDDGAEEARPVGWPTAPYGASTGGRPNARARALYWAKTNCWLTLASGAKSWNLW